MRKDFLVVLALASHLGACLCLGGCEGDDPGTEPGTEPGPGPGTGTGTEVQAGKVTGVVQDTQGRPIAGAKVRIENDFGYYDVTTDANGRYVSPSLVLGGFKAIAWADVNYQGKSYKLRMGMPNPADYDFFDSKQGAVRNFRWQLSGRIPDRVADGSTGYFGGTLESLNGTGSIYDARMDAGDTVNLTLKPTAPLIDGSTGQTLTRSFTIRSGNDTYYALDIPVGVYEVTAERVTPSGAREQILVGSFSRQGTSATVSFEPSSAYSYESGLRSTSLYLVLNR
ncbi:carboxypeptidase-like regulatory domain-containing protein [Archangium sp.]|uniref:carboxypeptidase-like regulatory domain-containing protein n=1 Tax=Archangium sp. TaxID=1872627 RepID=UPI002EDA3F2B